MFKLKLQSKSNNKKFEKTVICVNRKFASIIYFLKINSIIIKHSLQENT